MSKSPVRPVSPPAMPRRTSFLSRNLRGVAGLAVAGLGLAAWLNPQPVKAPWAIRTVAAQQAEQAGGAYGPGKTDGEFDFVARPSRRYVSGRRSGGPIQQTGFAGAPTFDQDPTDAELMAAQGEGAGGFGVMARAGHVVVTDDNPIASDSLTFVNAVPYTIVGNTMLLSDLRLYRTNGSQTGGSAGVGIRQYLPGWNKVLGATGFYDSDDSRDRKFQQLSLALELLGENFDLRANGYMPIDDTVQVTGTRIQANSERFAGNELLFTRLTDVSAAAKGVDMTAAVPLRGAGWMEAIGLEANGGWYHFQAADADAEKVWGGRAGVGAGFFRNILKTSIDVTTDNVFDTNLLFTVEVAYHGGMDSLRRRGGQKNRLAEFIDRNWTVTTINDTIASGGEQAINPATGNAYRFLHVANNGLADGSGFDYPSFDPLADEGTFENPLTDLATAINQAGTSLQTDDADFDVVYTRAGSLYGGDDFAGPLVVPDGLRLLGEGFSTDAGPPREVINQLPVANFGSVAGTGSGIVDLPTPTNDLINDENFVDLARSAISTARPDVAGLINFPERPTLRGLDQGDYGVELGNNVEFSGWRIENNQTALAALYAEGLTNGAPGLDGTPRELSEDVTIFAQRGARSLGDGVLLENTSGDLLFSNLRIGSIADDPVLALVDGVEVATSGFVEGTPDGVSFRVVGGDSDIAVVGTGLEAAAAAPSLIAQTGSLLPDGTIGPDQFAVLINGMADGSQVNLVGATIFDGLGLFDADNDPTTAAVVLDGGAGVLVGSLNNPVNLGAGFTNNSDVDFGAITTGGAGGNTQRNGVAISNTTGITRFFAPVEINNPGAELLVGGAGEPGTHAGLLVSNLSATGQVIGLDTALRDGSIDINNRFGAGVDLNNVAGSVNLNAAVEIDAGTNAPTAAGINFQRNTGDASFGFTTIDGGAGPGVNVGLEQGIDPAFTDLADRNGAASRLSFDSLTIDNVGSPDTTAAGGLGTANVQVLDDFASVTIDELFISNRGGVAIDVFETRGTLNFGLTDIDDNGTGAGADVAVRIREVGDDVRFSSLTVDNSELDTVFFADTTRNIVDGPGSVAGVADLTGFVTDNPVVLIENNTFGGSGTDGASVDLGTVDIETDGGLAIYANNNRELAIDGGTLTVVDAPALYAANTFDFDVTLDVVDAENSGPFAVRVVNAGTDSGGIGLQINAADITDSGNAIYVTDLDGDFLFQNLDIENDVRGVLVENRNPDDVLDFGLNQLSPTLAAVDDPLALATEALFDVSNAGLTVTEGTISDSVIDGDDGGTFSAIRLRNVQNVTLSTLELDGNFGETGGDEQIQVDFFGYDDDTLVTFNYILSNSVLTDDGLGFTGGFDGLLDVDNVVDLSDLRFDIFDNIFNIDNPLTAAINIETDGRLGINPATNRGISNNLVNGDASGDQIGVRIRQDNDELDNQLAFLDNQFLLGAGVDDIGYDLEFDGPLDLRIGVTDSDQISSVVAGGTNAIGVRLELDGAASDVTIDNTSFVLTGAGVTGILVDQVRTPSRFNFAGNAFTFGTFGFTATTLNGFGNVVTTTVTAPIVSAVEFNQFRLGGDGGTDLITLRSDNPIGVLPDTNITNFAGSNNSIFINSPRFDLFSGQSLFDGQLIPIF